MSASFPQRKIGETFVSAIGLGCMGMSIGSAAGPPDDEESLQVLTEAANQGINFWTTSDSYGPHINELLLGRWIKETGRRDEIFLASKFGVKIGANISAGKFEVSGEPEYIKEACNASLKRLNTDHIDLYIQQRVDPNTPIERVVEAMAQLKQEGKIRYLGLSECSARTLRRAHKVHPIAAVEMEFSPFALEIESSQTQFLETARELGVKIIPYSPLGRGFLTGAIRSIEDVEPRRRMIPRFSEEHFDDNLKLADALAAIAAEKNCKPGQLALAWVLAQGDDFIPIPGTKHVKYLRENAGAINVKLSKEDDQKIRSTIERLGGAKGARYPDIFLSYCFGDSVELDAAV